MALEAKLPQISQDGTTRYMHWRSSVMGKSSQQEGAMTFQNLLDLLAGAWRLPGMTVTVRLTRLSESEARLWIPMIIFRVRHMP